MQAVVEKQDLIGWQAAFEGCWATEWSFVQEKYFEWQEKRNSGRRWLIAIIRKLWEIAWDLWSQRNQFLHEVETASLHSHLIQQIRDEYARGFRGLTNVRELTGRPLQSLLTALPATQQAWLHRIQAARTLQAADQLTRERQQVAAQRSFMRRWLRR